jgi:hypothetical protein
MAYDKNEKPLMRLAVSERDDKSKKGTLAGIYKGTFPGAYRVSVNGEQLAAFIANPQKYWVNLWDNVGVLSGGAKAAAEETIDDIRRSFDVDQQPF